MKSILKPWFIWNPRQLFLRFARVFSAPDATPRPLRAVWGADFIADPTKPLGRSLLHTGVYDLAVSEVLARLIQPGETVVDAGANLGYMSVLAGALTGRRGKVFSFEPHPELFKSLQANIARARATFPLPDMTALPVALGEADGSASLVIPDEMATNEGLAYIATEAQPAAGSSIDVPIRALDGVLPNERIDVMKIDVEGHELSLLRGAKGLLASGSVRHIVFEDHEGDQSAAARLLADAGYQLFSIGWLITGPAVERASGRKAAHDYEAPSYLATLDPEEAIRRCRPRGWRVLRRLPKLS